MTSPDRHHGELVVVTGMTGAGRSTAAKELEDLGFYVVDNMPPSLLRDVVRLVDESRGTDQPIAVVVDVRSGSFFQSLQANLAQGRHRAAYHPGLPRGHRRRARPPPGGRPPAAPPAGRGRLLDGLQRERKVLADLRSEADLVIDTTTLNVHQLTDRIAEAFGTPGQHEAERHGDQLRVQVRHPRGRRLRGRHAVPAQPVLGAGAAGAHRP